MSKLPFDHLDIPSVTYLSQDDIPTVERYLIKKKWLSPAKQILRIEKPGAGNMNLVLRVIPSEGVPFIVKQARPWVEKYPDLKAPVERIQVENEYYQYLQTYPLLSMVSPAILGFDEKNSVMIMEDLGEAVDFSFIYRDQGNFSYPDLQAATAYLNNLKQIPAPKQYPSNLTLRRLNHQHIFQLPFSDNQFDLETVQPGLQQLAEVCKRDNDLRKKVSILGSSYLSKGKFLLHGDFYPGSLLNTVYGLKVIDPEFSFIGPEEWDMAIFVAHLFLSKTPSELITDVYCKLERSKDFKDYRFAGYVGTEILRRILGLAQLPLELDLKEKSQLIEHSIDWIKSGKIHTLSCYEKYYFTG